MKMLLSLIFVLSYVWIHVGSVGFADENSVRCAKLLGSFHNELDPGQGLVTEAKKVKKGATAKTLDSNDSRENVQKVRYVEEKISEGVITRPEVDERVRRLLAMDAHSIQKVNGKTNIFLGHQLKDNSTIQFEYALVDLPQYAPDPKSSRGISPNFSKKFILVGIRFIPKNLAKTEDKTDERAYELAIKNPLKAGTLDLAPDLFTDFWVDPDTGAFHLSAPKKKDKTVGNGIKESPQDVLLPVIPVLHGAVLEKFLRYKETIDLLERVTVDTDLGHRLGLMRLKVHGGNSKLARAFKERIGKRIINFIILVAAVTAIYKLPGYYQEFVKPSIDQTVPSQVVTGADYTHFAYISQHVTDKWSTAPSFVTARDNIMYSEAVSSPKVVDAGIKQLAQLISLEKENEGKISLVAFDEGLQFLERLTGDRRKDAFTQPPASLGKADSFILVGLFKKTEKIFLAKVHYQESQDKQDKPFWISYLTFDRKQEPELFVGLTKLIQTQMKAAKEAEAQEAVAAESKENVNSDSPSTFMNIMNLFSTLNPLTQVQGLMNSNTGGHPGQPHSVNHESE
jgi:hypothetical protein